MLVLSCTLIAVSYTHLTLPTSILHQKNGDMLVLSCTLIDGICYSFVSKFDSNNNYITHIARFADRPQFESLLDAYFVFG